MSLPIVKLTKGIHVMHLFYRIDRVGWTELSNDESGQTLAKLEKLCAANAAASHPRITTYANVGNKADLVVMLTAAELGTVAQMHRDFEACFPPGTLESAFSYLSITELPDYITSEEEMAQSLIQEKLEPGTEIFEKRLKEMRDRHAQYEHYRLYPEMPDWELMGFYPMSKRRSGSDNWYSLDFATRKKLMAGHARVGRKYAGRISQLITGSVGLDDWEWGVTLMAHQTDSLKEIVYEMRFDEVTARFGEFGPFYVNLRLSLPQLWDHLHLR
ncbi:MAG: Chlorite dismutase [Verrucomicrobiales bacterium]|jgi:peroxiredoxin|nr:Chlorite dismutase [Verrucomicrobiales bacterium]